MNKYHGLWALAALGLALHAAGLGWDAWMHANDPDLAAREGIFTLENPSHLLIIAGVGIASAAVIAMAIAWLTDHRVGGSGPMARVLRVSGLPAVALVAAGTIWLASLEAEPHDHNDGSHSHLDLAGHTHDDHFGFEPSFVRALAAVGLDADGHSHDVIEPDHSHPDTVAAVQDPEPGEGGPHFHSAEFDVTPDHLLAAADFYARVKSEAAKYENVADALAMGYIQVTPDLPGIAAHFVRVDYMANGVYLDPTQPEQVLYSKRLDGTWRLVGFVFTVPASEPEPSYFGSLDAWHYHENLCFGGNASVTTVAKQSDCLGVFQARTAWLLHVWVVEGADGAFAHDLPAIDPGTHPPARVPAAQEVAVRRP